jgi:hypothetical protein
MFSSRAYRSCLLLLVPYLEVAELRRSIAPPLRPYYNLGGQVVGVTTDLADGLAKTMMRMIAAGQADFLAHTECSLVVRVTSGLDGRGGEKGSVGK